jgi:hypothetical protein
MTISWLPRVPRQQYSTVVKRLTEPLPVIDRLKQRKSEMTNWMIMIGPAILDGKSDLGESYATG